MEELEVHLRQLQEELSNLLSLREHPGYKDLMEVAQGQIDNRFPSVLKPLDSLLEITKREHELGEMSGIKLFTLMTDARITSLEEDISKIEEELGYDDAERTGHSASGDSGSDEGDRGDFEPSTP